MGLLALSWTAALCAIRSSRLAFRHRLGKATGSANAAHPFLVAQDAAGKGRDVEVRIQLRPVQAQTLRLDDHVGEVGAARTRQALSKRRRKTDHYARIERYDDLAATQPDIDCQRSFSQHSTSTRPSRV